MAANQQTQRCSAFSPAACFCCLGGSTALAAASGREEFCGTGLSPWRLSQNADQGQEVKAVLMALVCIKITLLQEPSYSLRKACLALLLPRPLAGRSFNQAKFPPQERLRKGADTVISRQVSDKQCKRCQAAGRAIHRGEQPSNDKVQINSEQLCQQKTSTWIANPSSAPCNDILNFLLPFHNGN